MKKIAIILIIGLVFTSCYMKYPLSMDFLKPAYVTIPARMQSFSVGASFSVFGSDNEDKSRKVQNYIKEVDTLTRTSAIEGIINRMAESPRVKSITIADSLPDKKMEDLNGAHPWPVIFDVTNKDKTDAFICAEEFSIRDTLIESPDTDYLMLLAAIGWRMYDPVKGQIFEYVQKDTFYTDVTTAVSQIYEKDFQERILSWVCNEMGYRMADKFFPFWEENQRKVIYGGNELFYTGARLMDEGNWDEAAEVWQKILAEKSGKTAARASYNMAMVCEAKDQLEIGIEWLEKAEDAGLKEATPYKVSLRKRLKAKSLLIKQLNGESNRIIRESKASLNLFK